MHNVFASQRYSLLTQCLYNSRSARVHDVYALMLLLHFTVVAGICRCTVHQATHMNMTLNWKFWWMCRNGRNCVTREKDVGKNDYFLLSYTTSRYKLILDFFPLQHSTREYDMPSFSSHENDVRTHSNELCLVRHEHTRVAQHRQKQRKVVEVYEREEKWQRKSRKSDVCFFRSEVLFL